MALIIAEKLGKEYESGEDKVIALAEASFTVESGEFLGIIGPSGSGKSTGRAQSPDQRSAVGG